MCSQNPRRRNLLDVMPILILLVVEKVNPAVLTQNFIFSFHNRALEIIQPWPSNRHVYMIRHVAVPICIQVTPLLCVW